MKFQLFYSTINMAMLQEGENFILPGFIKDLTKFKEIYLSIKHLTSELEIIYNQLLSSQWGIQDSIR